jgi:hypothetical protein
VLLAAPVRATPVSYQLTGSTDFGLQGLIVDVPVQGRATLDFDGARVTVLEFEISFQDLVSPPFMFSIDGVLTVEGGSGLRNDEILRFDQPSFAVLDAQCTGSSACDAFVGREPIRRGPALLADFVFDASGGFTTSQRFDGLLPIGVGGDVGMGGSPGARVGLTLQATAVPEPSQLGLLLTALLALARLRFRVRTGLAR